MGGALVIAGGLALVTGLTFLPSLRNGFVWDDLSNLVNNPAYRGIGWAQLRWMATSVHMGHYIPLTRLTFALDYTVWGMDPVGYHLTNVLLHAVNAALFYLVALRLLTWATALSGAPGRLGALVAALFFALHPLRAESVAWVTERRDVLAGGWFLVTVLTYLRACETTGARRRWSLAASVVAHFLALASKSIVMTVPVVLFLLDVYPLRRLPGGPPAWWRRSVRGVWVEKLPYALLSLGAAIVASYAQLIVKSLGTYPWSARVAIASYGLAFYLVKTVLPLRLSPLYEVPVPLDPLELRFLGSLLGVIGITVTLVLLRRRWPAGLAAWIYYVVMLAPVTGLVVRAGFQLAADRYSYLGCLGWAVLIGAGVGAIARGRERGVVRPSLARLFGWAVAGGLVGLAALTWRQVEVWHDEERLWSHAVAVTPRCALCHNNLGAALAQRGAPASALPHFEQAVAVRPDRIEVRDSLGLVLAELGRFPEAIVRYQEVLAQRPTAIETRMHLAAALLQSWRAGEAIEQLERVLAQNPEAGSARLGLIRAYLALGRVERARAEYDILRRLNPPLAGRLAPVFGSLP